LIPEDSPAAINQVEILVNHARRRRGVAWAEPAGDTQGIPVALEPEPDAAYSVSGMSGERNLDALLRTLSPRLVDGLFVFATVLDDALPEEVSPQAGVYP
jgi:hypothetical protein